MTTSTCDLCHQHAAGRAGICRSCRQWRDYWNSLTEEEKIHENQMMFEYVAGADY